MPLSLLRLFLLRFASKRNPPTYAPYPSVSIVYARCLREACNIPSERACWKTALALNTHSRSTFMTWLTSPLLTSMRTRHHLPITAWLLAIAYLSLLVHLGHVRPVIPHVECIRHNGAPTRAVQDEQAPFSRQLIGLFIYL